MSNSGQESSNEENLSPETKEERAREQRYWNANVRLIRNLLIIWVFVSLGCGILLVPLLNNLAIGNLPFGFWMAQQGSIFIFVILIFVYAIRMDKLDRRYRRK
ncbi:putative solute:sodium symporter small subunit [Xenococcus sp. PCC 7305]|uniref:DUF4212 domain-containing protein n=1 Tax=Xenococcus sp. PCC 7305 TaxID=102125 RepID=UPI0002AC185A|nr:DUF4212 domain-containing protein [Xenococcus sp. PCC 7305]ELS01671.1 putative solute:sodium symporter small subunit [Xenococcus sp. PCC 7305]